MLESKMDDGKEFRRLKQCFEDVVVSHNIKGKTHFQLEKGYKRETLAEALVKVMDICQQTMNLHEKAISLPCLADDIISKVKDEIATMVPNLVSEVIKQGTLTTSTNDEMANPQVSVNNDRHVIVLKDKDDASKFNEQSWSEVVQGTISPELKKIPVNKSVLNKEGHGCLFFPNKEAQADAKAALEPLFKVTTDNAPKKKVMPKIKVYDIDIDTYSDKTDLREAILDKNQGIASLIERPDDFTIVLIDSVNKYAVLKVTPEIRKYIISHGKIYLGMYSLRVRDHFHPLQCFSCQQHGHKQGSPDCKHHGKSDKTCLYCAGDHLSKDCPNKKDASKHACANCLNSSNPEHRKNALHKSTSFKCPFVVKEVNSLIYRTGGIHEIEAKKLKITIR